MSTLKTNRIENLTTTDGGISIDNGGRVGLGTSTPGSFSSSTNNLVVSETGGNSGITLHTGSSNSSFLGFTDTGDTNNQGYIGYSHSDNALLFAANSAERLRIISSGKVGIGTSNPQELLQIGAGYSSSNGTLLISADAGFHHFIRFTNGGGTDSHYPAGIWYQPSGRMELRAASSSTTSNEAQLVLADDGNVGIGDSSPSDKLSVSGGNVGIYNTGNSHGNVYFYKDGTTKAWVKYRGDNERLIIGNTSDALTIDSSGNVLINTTTLPTSDSKLTVQNSGSACEFNVISGTSSGSVVNMGDTDDYNDGRIKYDNSSRSMQFQTANTERMRITSSGYAKCSDSGSYYNSGASYHEFNQSIAAQNTIFNSTHSNFGATHVALNVSRVATTAYWFLQGVSGFGSGSDDTEFYIRGDGNAYIDGSWNGGGADYAEYFEWSDGNTKTEDRRGISVVLDGNKIREAVAGEEPIGVISGNPSVVGDADVDRWKGKYLRDDFGTYIQEDYEVEDEDGNTVVQQRRKLNPDYNPDTEYVSREDRPEWDCVGLMGKLRIRKGQVTGARWIKMRDISDSVEEWLVR